MRMKVKDHREIMSKKTTSFLIQSENCAILGVTVGKGILCDDIIPTLRN